MEHMFTIDGNIMTCAGGMAGIDLMLQRIKDSHDHDLADEVARQMLHQFPWPGKHAPAPEQEHPCP